MRKVLILLGVPVDDLTMSEALDRIESFIMTGRASGKSHQIATVNADFVVNSLHDPELRRILQESDMATADGMPLVWGSRMLGVSLEDRVTGADLVPALCERAARKGFSIYLLGARPGIAARASEMLQERYPGLRVVGVHSPANRPLLEMEATVIEQVRAARPDILLVAFGNPKQEKWISMHARDLQVPVSIGIGGTLDMIVGVTQRAPAWMQRSGLEWMYRLAQEPKRLWKRYAVDMVYFSYFYFWQLLAMRRGSRNPTILPTTDTVIVENTGVVNVKGRLDRGTQNAFIQQATQALEATPHLVINLAQATFLDSSALGTLVTLANQARTLGGSLVLVDVPASITQILKLVKLDQFFEIQPHLDAAIGVQRSSPTLIAESVLYRSEWHVLTTPRILDASTAPAMIEAGRHSLEQNTRLVVDLSATTFLASAGLAAMIQLNKLAQERGGALRVAGANGDTLRTIQLVKLDTILSLFNDVATATSAPNQPKLPIVATSS